MVVGVNCGHTVSGQNGSGAVGFLNESNETRNVGYRLIDYLRGRGVTVIDCTDNDASSESENLARIVALANAQPLDLFVSIHFNAGGGRGSEVYTYNGDMFLQAELTCENLATLGFINRGIKDGSNLYVIRRTAARAMLVEICFVDTKSDADLYGMIGPELIAKAIGDAILGERFAGDNLTVSMYEELKQLIEVNSARIDKLANDVAALKNPMIYDYIDENMPDWAREAVLWCVENEIIYGTGDGRLNLDDTKLWTCVVIYRLAQNLG